MSLKAIAVHIKGLVQGVGFRPFVYRMALSNEICGWVVNGNDGVRIHAQGDPDALKRFLQDLEKKAPAASEISEILTETATVLQLDDFIISKSTDISGEITEISPDIAVCEECLADMKVQPNRLDYPLINCTNCGPRFSIIRELPYDRPKTTMARFNMCPECRAEYENVSDRRFHAQPVACNVCGPRYSLVIHGNTIYGMGDILKKAGAMIRMGKVIAVKGTGGFHLVCDARNESAVQKLRSGKYREGKPFAVMFSSLDACKMFALIHQDEDQAITSWRRPIVILKNNPEGAQLAPSVSNGFSTIGAMLPYMPVHYLLFEETGLPALVFTSGNISDEPVLIDNDEAIRQLSGIADAFLIYDREIYNRADDSVVLVAANRPGLLRRSRGFAPSPVVTGLDTEGIVAVGAELVNCFCVGKGNQAILSQHIGDLKNLETLRFFEESFDRYLHLFRVQPELIVCDLHPDYLSTRFAYQLSDRLGGIPVMAVQHHHAHIASCMADNGLDCRVIGLALDGVGLGTDGNIWGFEVMLCDLATFDRALHLDYIPQPGGDMTGHEPWRMALSYLDSYAGNIQGVENLPFFSRIGETQIEIIRKMIRHRINSPLTSSAGRLFDAIAAITGVAVNTSFHAEAPMRLEDILDQEEPGAYEFIINAGISAEHVIRSVVRDLQNDVPSSKIAARFHRAVVNALVHSAVLTRARTGVNTVVLSGGSFQNRFLLSETIRGLRENGFEPWFPSRVPANDGGIALGQAAIAAKRRSLGLL